MFTTTQQTTQTITKTFLTPEVQIVGQVPNRTANLVFPCIDEQENNLPPVNVTIHSDNFDTFYTNWDSDAYLFTFLPDVTVPEEVTGDILNNI